MVALGGKMRTVVKFVACVASALSIAGCSPLDGLYIREGIGTGLSTPELAEVTDLQNVYIGEVCRQAGLRVSQHGSVLYCDEVGMRPNEWATFVQAGMNDIDRRCDAYLAWLDNKRRWREPILKQLNTAAAATGAILGLTGVGADPIAIVATAFGFASDTFINFHSRLITEVNHSVIQSVVLDNQNQFRVKTASVLINNRPAAIYLLRNYLRICMPFSIEMSINNTVTVFHRGGAEALGQTAPILTRAPTVARISESAAAARSGGPVVRSTEQPPKVAALPQTILNPRTDVEETISLAMGKAFQKTLCLPETGDFDATTRTALRDFYAAVLYPTDANAPDSVKTDAELRRLRDARAAFPSCKAAGFLGPYEVGTFLVNGAEQFRSWLASASRVAQIAVPPALSAPTTGSGMNSAMRDAVRALRVKYNLSGQPVIDRAFFVQMMNAITR